MLLLLQCDYGLYFLMNSITIVGVGLQKKHKFTPRRRSATDPIKPKQIISLLKTHVLLGFQIVEPVPPKIARIWKYYVRLD